PGAVTLVNGLPARDALLAAGDQVAVAGKHRFVVEVPWIGGLAENAPDGSGEAKRSPSVSAESQPRGVHFGRWPWLLLAAALLAALLSALLMFAPR
ncbi:MAG TPA: FHA domain-containing protein, partial [Pseudoxanthomonas sp.]|nr:FHA domain-containing protein [Pseudoxanthomonas sp.]